MSKQDDTVRFLKILAGCDLSQFFSVINDFGIGRTKVCTGLIIGNYCTNPCTGKEFINTQFEFGKVTKSKDSIIKQKPLFSGYPEKVDYKFPHWVSYSLDRYDTYLILYDNDTPTACLYMDSRCKADFRIELNRDYFEIAATDQFIYDISRSEVKEYDPQRWKKI